MRCSVFVVQVALGLGSIAKAASTLLSGGTIIAFDDVTQDLQVIRNGSILVTNDRIASVHTSPSPSGLPDDTTTVDVSHQIITPGFVDTHRHGWQTAFKTIASNTTLVEYLGRYGEYAAAASFTPDDVYLGQLVGMYESLSAGVTTILDHAHHTWSNATADAGLRASIDSRARVFWAYTFHDVPALNYTIQQQIPHFRSVAADRPFAGSPVELGIAYDAWGPNPNVPQAQQIVDLATQHDVSVLTTHCLDGPWGATNNPSDLHRFGILNTTLPVVFSHASFITANDAQLLRATGQYVSITPESEMHYGHTHQRSRFLQDQAALGVDTHFTFSADILTQARLWLQTVRYDLFDAVQAGWEIPTTNPMSAVQAFLLATRSGGQALRRPDIGVIQAGAKADLVVWDAKESVSMLGWVDPVAAVMLHANPGDVLHVLVDGKFVKRDGRLTDPNYTDVRARFLESARKIQGIWRDLPYPVLEGEWQSGYALAATREADVLAGEGTGYGQQYLD